MRRIVKGKIKFISLCKRGKNKLPTIFKADDGEDHFELEALTKAGDNFDEKGELLAVVYAPEVRDSEGDIASAEVIKDMAHGFAKEGEGIDIRHNEKALSKEDAFIAESFIIQKDDPRFTDFKNLDGEPVDVTGGWGVVIKVENEALRAAYRSGEWGGVSMGGAAKVRVDKSDESIVDLLVKKLTQSDHNGDIDMTKEELTAALKEQTTAIVDGVSTAITKALTPEQKPKDNENKSEGEVTLEAARKMVAEAEAKETEDAPVFKGDWSDAEAVRKHEKAVRLYDLRKSLDMTKPDDIKKYREESAKIEAEFAKAEGDDEEDIEKEEFATDRERELASELARLRKASNVPASGKKQPQTSSFEGIELSKEEREADQAGASMAAFINGQRGYVEQK